MSSKRPSLAETMQKVARPETRRVIPAANDPTSDAAEHPRNFYAATRAGKKKITAAVGPDVHLKFRQLGLEAGKTNENLLIEAINDLFIKYGKPPIA
jgi:hypothetical protein